MSNNQNLILSLTNVTKNFGKKEGKIVALDNISLSINKGSYTVILGRSGSGKSTLLNLMAGLDTPSNGEINALGQNLSKSNSSKLANYRSKVGIIFQFYNLLPNLNTLENVMMGAWAGGHNIKEEKGKELLEKLGLGHRMKSNVKTLSGGEKQRVAIARSLISDPQILFCDEPTGALDSHSEKQVQEILNDLNKKQGLTIILVTHNSDFLHFSDNVIKMEDGKQVINDDKNKADLKVTL